MWKRAAFNFTESEIRYAISVSFTFTEAARFLHCSPSVFSQYAKMYYDHASGKSLWQLLKDKKHGAKKGTKKNSSYSPLNCPMEDIFAGKHPSYLPDKLQRRLIVEGYLIEQCNICGFNARRIGDYKIPLKLAWKNKVTADHSLDNLELVCYNCFYLYYGEIFDKRYRVDPKMYSRHRNLIPAEGQ